MSKLKTLGYAALAFAFSVIAWYYTSGMDQVVEAGRRWSGHD